VKPQNDVHQRGFHGELVEKSWLQRIATQRWIQAAFGSDFVDVFPPKHSLRSGFTAYIRPPGKMMLSGLTPLTHDPVFCAPACGVELASGRACRHCSAHCGQSLQSVIPIMISEPTATTTGRINGNSSSTATTAARPIRVLFKRAKRQPATRIRTTPFGPQQRLSDSINAKRSATADSGVTLDEGE
jgi:hypothetical protein